MRKITFTNNSFYHIYNRGVEKRNIFLDKEDYLRFIHNLFEFNDINTAGKFSQKSIIGVPVSDNKKKKIYSWKFFVFV
ncbi:MAG: hypothetical protein ACP5IX_03580, partial [Patescibacteria group bacterium]